MENREPKLLENDIFIAGNVQLKIVINTVCIFFLKIFIAIYLDPRYMCLLSDEDKKKAVEHLLKTSNLKDSFTLIEVSHNKIK